MSAANTNRSGVLKLWLLNLVGNAVVLAAWYYWLLIPDAHGWQVVWSAVLASLVVVFVLWLRAGTLIYFRVAEFRNKPTIDVAFRRGFRHIVPLALWAALGAAIAWLILQAGNYTPQFSVWIRQKANAGLPPLGSCSALLGDVPSVVGARCNDDRRDRLFGKAYCPFVPRVAAAALLDTALHSHGAGRVGAVQAGHLGSGCDDTSVAGMERRPAVCNGLYGVDHRVHFVGLDGRRAHGAGRPDRVIILIEVSFAPSLVCHHERSEGSALLRQETTVSTAEADSYQDTYHVVKVGKRDENRCLAALVMTIRSKHWERPPLRHRCYLRRQSFLHPNQQLLFAILLCQSCRARVSIGIRVAQLFFAGGISHRVL
jgi:hypothetical protein